MKNLLDIIADSIKVQHNVNVARIDDDILQIDKGESPRFIDFSFENEARIGIGGVVEFLPYTESGEDMIKRFYKILSCRVERITFRKGQMVYKVHYNLILPNGEKEIFGTHMTWLFPYWRKTTSKINIEGPIISEQEVNNEIERIRTTYNTQ
ncbi:hypothetical protein [Plebeiibacterium sediminum]|uniref:Uncharacterized protein n=1 Tax=Plebeiibacterium sediminum TaxID=2992112 RepID=A0AAE3M232_9BACT|nr:hypothetical protein [Plebeiobacterium sediminum]MCW3785674.1 hypothetical protein [Plebeiobacterium sediminum]